MINSTPLKKVLEKSIDSLRKNFNYKKVTIIIIFGILEIIAIHNYYYFKNKYHIDVYD